MNHPPIVLPPYRYRAVLRSRTGKLTDAVGLRRCNRVVLMRFRRPGEINSRATIDSFGSPIPAPPKPTPHIVDLGTYKAGPVTQLIHKLIEK